MKTFMKNIHIKKIRYAYRNSAGMFDSQQKMWKLLSNVKFIEEEWCIVEQKFHKCYAKKYRIGKKLRNDWIRFVKNKQTNSLRFNKT